MHLLPSAKMSFSASKDFIFIRHVVYHWVLALVKGANGGELDYSARLKL